MATPYWKRDAEPRVDPLQTLITRLTPIVVAIGLEMVDVVQHHDIEARDYANRNNGSRKTGLPHLVLSAGILQASISVELAKNALSIVAESRD